MRCGCNAGPFGRFVIVEIASRAVHGRRTSTCKSPMPTFDCASVFSVVKVGRTERKYVLRIFASVGGDSTLTTLRKSETIKHLFSEACDLASQGDTCVVFIDEVDAIASNRDANSDRSCHRMLTGAGVAIQSQLRTSRVARQHVDELSILIRAADSVVANSLIESSGKGNCAGRHQSSR